MERLKPTELQVPQLVLIPLPGSDLVVAAMVRATHRAGMSAVIFGPATSREFYVNDDGILHNKIPTKWTPRYLRKLRTTDFPLRVGLWEKISIASPEMYLTLKEGESVFAQFVHQIASASTDQLYQIDFAEIADLTEGASAAGVPIYCSPENSPVEESIAYLVGQWQPLCR